MYPLDPTPGDGGDYRREILNQQPLSTGGSKALWILALVGAALGILALVSAT